MGAAEGRVRSMGIDVLRGLAMIVMALDHVREYFSGATFYPLDLEATTPAYFFTRWVTHFAAPIFVLLAGVSAHLAGRRRLLPELSAFLFKRGLFLVVLELTVIAWAFTFAPEHLYAYAQVIWALGWSMVALAALVWLPRRAVGIIGGSMILLHNLLDSIQARDVGQGWNILHEPGPFSLLGREIMFVDYPLIPWIGVMALGYACAPVLDWPTHRRDRILAVFGVLAIALFFLLRATRLYGDPHPWDPSEGFLGFLNVTKYPASLQFLLITLGPPIALFPWLDRASGKLWSTVATYGQAPLFYYVTHLYLIHALAFGLGLTLGWPADELRHFFQTLPSQNGWGWGLPVVYVVWVGVVAFLLPFTARWARLKRERKDVALLSYL